MKGDTMKVRLVTIPEEEKVLRLWEEKSKELLGPEYQEKLGDYREAVEEMIGHANVYVLEKEGDIIAFTSIVGGYYISNFFVDTKEEGDLLMEFLQERYDELQIDVHHESKVNHWMENWGFENLGVGKHDILGYTELQYEWLK